MYVFIKIVHFAQNSFLQYLKSNYKREILRPYPAFGRVRNPSIIFEKKKKRTRCAANPLDSCDDVVDDLLSANYALFIRTQFEHTRSSIARQTKK